MTNHERAEKIIAYMCPDTNIPAKDFEFVTSQLDEAQREAELRVKHTCCQWNLENEATARIEGFAAAKEKAAGIVQKEYWNVRSEESEAEIRLADRIRKMEP